MTGGRSSSVWCLGRICGGIVVVDGELRVGAGFAGRVVVVDSVVAGVGRMAVSGRRRAVVERRRLAGGALRRGGARARPAFVRRRLALLTLLQFLKDTVF